ncbi:uncharacterized protein VTP21DRAFT_11492 [Calcarisporiella thermophila]|uniref:uncharacterized protein n=1 Tax=Calcarisporiella thermophila TaxID=911321 RepID=UPI0037430A0E
MSRFRHGQQAFIFCYYVSGHGWGHATRVNQIATELLRHPAGHTVYIISDASDFIFQRVICLGAQYRHALIDSGVIQTLPYVIDGPNTIAGVESFMKKRAEILREEASWLKSVRCDIVLCDAPFVPCAAAAKAGIPSALVTNFTFDEIYWKLREGNSSLNMRINNLVDQMISDYSHSALLVRLPGYINIPAFENAPSISSDDYLSNNEAEHITRKKCIIDVPLVVRKGQSPRDEVWFAIGIPPKIYTTHKILLLQFGGQVLSKDAWGDNPLPDGWICVFCGDPPSASLPSRFFRAPKDAYIPDLINAADVLLGKLGYGSCSEAIAHCKPLVYVPRPQFKEEEGLLVLMRNHGLPVEMPREQFESGEWGKYILQAAELKKKDPVPDNGGEIAARVLEKWVGVQKMKSLDNGESQLNTMIAENDRERVNGAILPPISTAQ